MGSRRNLRAVVDPHDGADSAGGGVPDPHRAVAAGGGQPGAVRGDRHRPHRAGVAGEGGALLRRWPRPRSAPSRRRRRWPARCRPGRSPPPVTAPVWPVRVARCWPVAASQIRTVPSSLAVASQVPSGAIATAVTVAGVAGEGGALLAGGRVPDPHRPVVAAGGQPGAVRGDRHRRHPAGVAGEGGALLAGGRVPDPHRPVVAGGGQPGAVRGDRHRRHRAGVAGEGGALLRRWPGPRSAPSRRRRRWPARCRPGRSPPPDHRPGVAGEGGALLAGGRRPRSAPSRRRRRWPARCRPGRTPPPSPRRCGR